MEQAGVTDWAEVRGVKVSAVRIRKSTGITPLTELPDMPVLSELKSCPLCGTMPEVCLSVKADLPVTETADSTIICRECGLWLSKHYPLRVQVQLWNRRV